MKNHHLSSRSTPTHNRTPQPLLFSWLIIILLMLPGLACSASTKPTATPTLVETDTLQDPPTLESAPETKTPAQNISTPAPQIDTPTIAVQSPMLEPGWYAYTNANVVRDLAVYQGVAYAATLGGMISWRLDSGYAMKYTPMDGMSHVSSYSIAFCEIPEPRILVGTLQGISIYDPNTGLWEQRQLGPEDSLIGQSKIERLFCDQDNHRLLIGYNGLGVLDLQNGDFQHFTQQNGLSWDGVTDITVKGSEIWVASGYKGVTHIKGDAITIFNKANGLPDEQVSSLAFDTNGILWAGASSGILNYKNGEWQLAPGSESLAGTNELEISPDGNIWAVTATLGGGKLCQFAPQTGVCEIDHPDEEKQAILALTLSEDGTPIYGTSAGVTVFANGAAKKLATEDQLASNYVDSLALDPDGGLWIGTDAGVHKIDPADPSGEWITYRRSEYPDMGGVWASAIAAGPDQAIWIAMVNGSASRYQNSTWSAFDEIYSFNSVTIDAQGNVWFGDDRKGVIVLNADGSKKMSLTKAEGLPDDNVQSVLADPDGNVWIATNKGLARYINGALETVFDQDHPGLPNNYVRDLALDANGNLLIGTFTGVARYQDGQVETLVDLLASDYRQLRLMTLAAAPSGRIWAGTDHGLLYSDDGAQWSLLTTQDGLLTNTISALIVDTFGTAWVGGGGSNFDGGGLLQIVP